jgi:hypothetical protein
MDGIDMSDPTEAFLQTEEAKEEKSDAPINLDFLNGVVKQAADHNNDSAMAGENE